MAAAVTEGVVVVVRRDGRYLLIRRAAGVIAPGAWCFVGGAIERGEDERQAVKREFQEEVAGHVRPVQRIWDYVRPDGRLRLFWWSAELDGDALSPNPAEVAELRWCTLDEIEHLPGVLASNLAFVAAVRRGDLPL